MVTSLGSLCVYLCRSISLHDCLVANGTNKFIINIPSRHVPSPNVCVCACVCVCVCVHVLFGGTRSSVRYTEPLGFVQDA